MNRYYKRRKIQIYHDLKFKYVIFKINYRCPISEKSYLKVIQKAHPKQKKLYIMFLMQKGFLHLANLTVLNLIENHFCFFSPKDQYDLYNLKAILAFLKGENKEACDFWEKSGRIKNSWKLPLTPQNYKILNGDWFAAIGHVAMLDFFIKYYKLYFNSVPRIIVKDVLPENNLTRILARKFLEHGLVLIQNNELEADFDSFHQISNGQRMCNLFQSEKDFLVGDFWHYQFPNGQILGYAHAASKIQKDWEKSNSDPLLKVTETEIQWLENFKETIGLPKNAWYVCLHVREPGYHQKWNKMYPTIRDANIESYYKAINEITNAGGWVIRMGDPSMKPIINMPNVIDYAHSKSFNPYADMLLPATCKFFIGTNSGYATIPVIFGTPCALTNWVPVGWPLWASQDLMIFKLFREKKTNKYLSLKEMFERGLVFIQNTSDLPTDIEVVDNSPEEIAQLTREMLEACVIKSIPLKKAGVSQSIMDSYENLARKHETFTGSRFGRTFFNQYPQVFNCLKTEGKEDFENKSQIPTNKISLNPSEKSSSNLNKKIQNSIP